jgi:hypothetical protein
MKTLAALLIFVATVAEISAQGFRPQRPPPPKPPGDVVTFAGVDFAGTPGPGSNVVAIVHFAVAQGAAVYGNMPMDNSVVPAALYLNAPQTIQVLPMVWSSSRRKTDAATKRERIVFEEGFDVKLPLVMNNFVFLPAAIPATLNYQAAGQGAAVFPPRQLQFNITIPKPVPAAPGPPKR